MHQLSSGSSAELTTLPLCSAGVNPSQRVHFILGEEVDDKEMESHPLFSEMEELVANGDDLEWKETARWVKFEEDVEEGGNRWSKPHVATLSLHSLFELRSLLLNGTMMLDTDATTLEQIADLVCDNMISGGSLPRDCGDKVREALLRRHRHQHEREGRKNRENMSRLPIIRSLTEIGRNQSASKSVYRASLFPSASLSVFYLRLIVSFYILVLIPAKSCPMNRRNSVNPFPVSFGFRFIDFLGLLISGAIFIPDPSVD